MITESQLDWAFGLAILLISVVSLISLLAFYLSRGSAQLIEEMEHAPVQNDLNTGRKIVCAANQYENGLMLVGIRHWDDKMHAQAAAYLEAEILPRQQPVQGFLDNRGIFLTREQAWLVAKRANQIIKRVGGDESGVLYSENLY